MNLPKNYQLRPGQRADPVMWRSVVSVPAGGFLPARTSIKMLFDRFGPGKAGRLQTWDRAEQDPDGPHWIGVRNGTPLHVDPRYPRFTHQVVVYNDGWALRGVDPPRPEARALAEGAAFCLDTHSPHQLVRDPRLGAGLYYLAASMDSPTPLPPDAALPRLLAFLYALQR